MSKEKMGEKRRCLSCNTAFFDLNHVRIVCPKCATVFQVIEPVRSSSRSAGAFNNRSRWPTPSLDISSLGVVSDIAIDNTSMKDDEEKSDDSDSIAEDLESDA
jgi:hypothetical protein